MAGELEKWIRIIKPPLYPFARLKNFFENFLMKGNPLIATGQVIANKFSHLSPTHTYHSTTHNKVIKRSPKEVYTNCIFVGAFYKPKRAIDLVNAINILKEKYPNIKCFMLGSGPLTNDLKKYIALNQLQQYVEMPGYVKSREELENYYRKADFLVLPSLTEGSPRVLPEAMSFGVIPLAVKGAGSNDYIIKPYENGALFKAKSAESLASELELFFENRELYEEALGGIYEYAQEYTLDRELDKVMKFVFKELEL